MEAVTATEPYITAGWCCGICYDADRLLARGRPVDDVVDFFRLDAPTLAARAVKHGHRGLAARLHPAGATTAPATLREPLQPTLPGVA